MTKKLIIGSLFGVFLALTGCGQKGDLYLPGQQATTTTQLYAHKIS